MSASSVKLLQAAAEIVGGNDALAARLGIEDALLACYLSNRRELPDGLLLKAVDIVLEDRRSRGASGEAGTTEVRGLPQ